MAAIKGGDDEYPSLFSSPFSGTFFQSVDNKTGRFRSCKEVFVPFLGDLFSIPDKSRKRDYYYGVFVPFLGDLFSIIFKTQAKEINIMDSFRPLSRGPFFNRYMV